MLRGVRAPIPMSSSSIVYLYAGPSLHGTRHQFVQPGPDASGAPLVWMPPARRGDAQALVARHAEPGILALADGTFHSYPAIGHIELRQAMEHGWTVVGLCSMGAIRASEMRHLGARPWGRVAKMFCDDAELPDDEVALVHGAEPPWLPLSEPMIHIREFLRQMRALDALTEDAARHIVGSMRERWYGERTLARLRALVNDNVDAKQAAFLLGKLADFQPYRLKQQDLEAFVASQPWSTLPHPSKSPPSGDLQADDHRRPPPEGARKLGSGPSFS